MTDDWLLETVERIQEAALEPALWPALLRRIGDRLEAHSAQIMLVDPRSGQETLGLLEGTDPTAQQEYLRDYFPSDIRVPRLMRAQNGRILRERTVWSEAERLASPLYHDFQRVHRLFEITGANISVEGQLGWFGVARREEAPFDAEQLRLLAALLPHLRQALRGTVVLADLEAQRRLLGDLWSAKGAALVALDTLGRTVFANGAAEALAAEGVFHLSNRGLGFTGSPATALLRRRLQALRDGRPAPDEDDSLLLLDGAGRQYGLRVLAVPSSAVGLSARPADVLLVSIVPLAREAGPSPAELTRFADLFAFSEAERRVLASLVAGEELADHARRRGVSLDTARKQAKSLLAKAGCRSQKQLLRLVERFCFLRER